MRSFLEYWSNTLENSTFSSAPEIVEFDVAVEVAEQLALFLPMKKELVASRPRCGEFYSPVLINKQSRHKILFSVPKR